MIAIVTTRLTGRALAAGRALLLSLLFLSGCSTPRHYDALLVLNDIASGGGNSLLKRRTPEPSRAPVAYTIAGRGHTADLYLPGDGKPEAGIVLVPGAVPDGKDNESMVALAMTLASARFAVLAALEDDVRGRVRFVLGVGGYHDMRASIRFFTTGYFEDNGAPRYLKPEDYAKLVFIKSVLDHISSRDDRLTLDAMVSARLRDSGAELSALAKTLGPEGLAVYRLPSNADPQETPRLLAALPQPIVATIDALTLDNKGLQRLSARLLLVHGKNDRLIPYPESLVLGNAVAPRQARVFILNRILGHVDLTLSRFFSLQLWREELPDAWRLSRAVNLLLLERERPAVE